MREQPWYFILRELATAGIRHGALPKGWRCQPRPERLYQGGDTAPVQTGRDGCWSRLLRMAYPGGVRVAGQDRADRGRAHLVCDGLRQRGSAMRQAITSGLRCKSSFKYIEHSPDHYAGKLHCHVQCAPGRRQARSIVEQTEPELQKVLTTQGRAQFPAPREHLTTVYERLR